ncbi:hypothetical protein FOA52_008974 [Chlamydomonas sp. UWO 241]|nr:hypothetical protein FOA52_008974 [Chlamydomonas sp. UWO 241]
MLNSVPSDQRVVVEWRDVDMFVPVLVIGEHASPDPGTSEQTNDDVESGGKPKPKQGAKKTLVDCFKAATPDAPKERMVLYKVSGCADPGELLALMGPSGSGKSSLLQAVGGRSAGRPTGSMTFNGKPLSKAMKRRIGYVAQDDLLFAALTVYEVSAD